MRACFNIDVPVGSFAFFVDVFADIIFVLDLLLNFRTAYVDEHGVMEERPRVIAKHYMRGWFFLDALSCMPFQYSKVTSNHEDLRSHFLV